MQHEHADSFWVVWNPQGRAPMVRHLSREAAAQEAKRLAMVSPGQEFIVLAGLESYKAVTITKTVFDEVPF